MAIRQELKLTALQVQTLESMQDDIDWLTEQITKARRASIDVTEMQSKLQDIVKLKTGLLQEYR